MPTTRELIAALDAAERARLGARNVPMADELTRKFHIVCDNAARPVLKLLDQCQKTLTRCQAFLRFPPSTESLLHLMDEIRDLLVKLPPKE